MAARPTISGGFAARRFLVLARTLLVGSVLLLWPCCVAADSLAEARSALNQRDFASAHTMFELEALRRDAIENQFTAEVNGSLKSRDKSEAHRLGNGWLARYLLE